MSQKRTIKIEVDAKDGIEQVDKLNKGVKDTSKSASESKGSFSKMKGGVQGLGVAFKALGIGLIVAAFVKLKDIFSGNIETARKFEKINAQLGAAFDVVRDAVEPLFMSLEKLFTDPLGSLQKFAEAIQQNLINRVKGLIDTFGALGKVVKGVFTRDMDLLKEGVNDAKDGFIQLNTGLDKAQRSKLADTFRGITKEINEETQAMGRLTEKLQNVRDRERDMMTVRANANKIIAESRLLAEDESLSMEERLEALKKAVAEEQRVADIEFKIQQDKVNALQEIIDLGKSSEEDMAELAAERARLTDLETASLLKQKRVVTEIVTFEKQIEAERQRASDKKLKDAELLQAQKEKELEVLRVAGMSQQELEIQQATEKYNKLLELAEKHGVDTTVITDKFNAQLLEINKKYNKSEEDAEKLSAENKRSILANSMGQVASLLGEESKAGKALAVGQALINTYSAAAAALAPPPVGAGPIFGPIAAIGAVAAGMANVKQILSTKLPGDSGGGGGGGPEPAVPQDTGLGPMSPNMEAVEQPTLGGGSQPAQAYVVENDISNAQALQNELDIQATL